VAKSASTKALDAVQSQLAKLLKPHGYIKSGRTFCRDAGDGVVQVANLQMRTFAENAPRMAMVDRFTVNLGIFIPELRPETPTPNAPVQEYDCVLRARIGFLMDPPHDHWWDLPGDVGEEMLRVMEERGLPFLQRFATRDAIVAQWIEFSEAHSLSVSPRAVVGSLLAARGDAPA
jgi:hypothetical protein